MIDYSIFADIARQKQENNKPKINITQYGYSPTICCFPQLAHIWELIGTQYKVEREFLILPDEILTNVVNYCIENSDKIPMNWYLYPNSIISQKPYILKPFRGVISQSDFDNGFLSQIEDKAAMGKFEQRVMAHKIMSSPLKDYKKPIIMGTAADLQEIMLLTANLLKEDCLWIELDENYETILGEYQWES